MKRILAMLMVLLLALTGCTKEETLAVYNKLVEALGWLSLTSDAALVGECVRGADGYTGAYHAEYEGFSGAEYKGFSTKAEAMDYLGQDAAFLGEEQDAADRPEDAVRPERAAEDAYGSRELLRLAAEDIPPEGTLLAYVDGSYSAALQKYAFGCVFLLPDGRIFTEVGNGGQPKSLEQRNVAGEMLGAMYAVKTALLNGFSAVELRYDYEGIEKWVTGAWRSKTELTQKYTQAMQEWGSRIRLTFTKVAAHRGERFNELADREAKRGLTEGDGIPKVRRIEEMTWYGTGTAE